ncbi:hypothetical protein [Pendulispora albinea]|uniref:Uncharacterized protein n=1 Tax=Pendulispora albinea TaxID=2741071 RepID=A0ABZ2M855_9BACT
MKRLNRREKTLGTGSLEPNKLSKRIIPLDNLNTTTAMQLDYKYERSFILSSGKSYSIYSFFAALDRL